MLKKKNNNKTKKKPIAKANNKSKSNIKSSKKDLDRKSTFKINGKYFRSMDEIAAYYKDQGKKADDVVRQFQLDKAKGYLSVAKSNLQKNSSQRNKFELIAKDIEKHKTLLDKKISEFNSEKSKNVSRKKDIDMFVKKMKTLDKEAKKFLQIRNSLVSKEAELVSSMKKSARASKKNKSIGNVQKTRALVKIEDEKEIVLNHAKKLLPKEMIYEVFLHITSIKNLNSVLYPIK